MNARGNNLLMEEKERNRVLEEELQGEPSTNGTLIEEFLHILSCYVKNLSNYNNQSVISSYSTIIK